MRPPLTPPEHTTWRAGDGTGLRGRRWVPQHAFRANPRDVAVIYLHGIQSHGGWYEWSASVLASEGLSVFMPDRRGSGLNAEARGDVDTNERWLSDIDDVALAASNAYGFQRFAVVGVSWGGKLAVTWALRRPEQTAAVLLVAPGVFPRMGLGPLNLFKVAVSLALHPTALYPIPLDDPGLFTANPAGQAFIRGDDLALQSASARFFRASSRLDRYLKDLPDGRLKAAATLVLAGRDRIIQNERTESWAQRITSGRVHVVTLRDASHTLDFEADAASYETLLREWARQLVATTTWRQNRSASP